MIIIRSKKKLKYSQNVHKRLANYHKKALESSKGDSHDIHKINMHYHLNIYDIQECKKRILSIVEREKVYSAIVRKYY